MTQDVVAVRPTPVSAKEKVGYALGDTATNFVWRAIIVFLPFFLTDAAGIGPAAVGVLLLVCRVWDGVTDIGMGFVADRTSTRWGKFRPWILWTAIPFGILGVLTFSTPDLGPTGRLVYAYVTYSALIVLYTMSNVPYSSLMGVMSPSPTERGSISSYRFVFAFLGGLFLQGFTPPLLAALRDPAATRARAQAALHAGGLGSWLEGAFHSVLYGIATFFDTPFWHSLYGHGLGFPYSATMTFFAVIAIVLFVVTFLATRERVRPVVEKQSVGQDFSDLLHNGPWLVLFAVGILFVTFTTLKNGVIMYYFAYYVGNRELAAAFMVAGLLGAMLGAAITGSLIRVMGKRRLMLYSIVLGLVSSALLYLPGPRDTAAMFTFSTITEFSTGPMVTLFFAMLADTADFSEWRTHRRATGLFYSAGTVAMKFGSGVGGALTGLFLAVFGYAAVSGGQEAVVQSAGAIHGIRLLISVFPAAVALLMLVAFWFYSLDEHRLSEIERDLAVRRAGPGSAAGRAAVQPAG
ncbi:MAG TPA: MFS transporter [Longimicrobiaceae bacterium]|nr:MFS transporter [Longimicrobiaceae bacterium]